MKEKIMYIENGSLSSIVAFEEAVYIQYLVEIGSISPIIEDNNRSISKEDWDCINPGEFTSLFLTNPKCNFYGSREFGVFYVKSKNGFARIKDGNMYISGELDYDLIDNIILLMNKLDIKRIVFKTYKTIPSNIASHQAITKIKDVRQYNRKKKGFDEIILNNVYQIFSGSGKYFVNGPFQKCKICRNWFRISEEEIIFMKQRGITGTHTCKRCKGRKVR